MTKNDLVLSGTDTSRYFYWTGVHIGAQKERNQAKGEWIEAIHLRDEEEDEHAGAKLPLPPRRRHAAAAAGSSIHMRALGRGHQDKPSWWRLCRQRTLRVHIAGEPITPESGRLPSIDRRRYTRSTLLRSPRLLAVAVLALYTAVAALRARFMEGSGLGSQVDSTLHPAQLTR